MKKFTSCMDLNIFDIKETLLPEKICLFDIRKEVNEIVWHLGGPAKASKVIGVKYSRLKEWNFRKPIPILFLKKLINETEYSFALEIKEKINSKNLVLRLRSKHWIKLPKKVTPELCYLIGILLGDGHMAGDSCNDRGNWIISVYFDAFEHLKIYSDLINSIFGCEVKIYNPPENCFAAEFGSRAVHWFLRSFFKLKNGAKCDLIEIPEIILATKNAGLISSCIKGLFDSDGTITKNTVKYASTSEKIVDQVINFLNSNGINTSKEMWLKNERYKPLYTARIRSKQDIFRFSELIGFDHPEKRKKLNTFLNSNYIIAR